jgi:hypothetical protein
VAKLVTLEVPVLLVVLPTSTLLVLLMAAGVNVVVEVAAADVDGFGLVVVISAVVLAATGREVVPTIGVLEVVV